MQVFPQDADLQRVLEVFSSTTSTELSSTRVRVRRLPQEGHALLWVQFLTREFPPLSKQGQEQR